MYTTWALGGHIRVVLEDNIYFDKGVLATNVQLVERTAQVIRLFGNELIKVRILVLIKEPKARFTGLRIMGYSHEDG